MTKKIKCDNLDVKSQDGVKLRVRVIRAPLVNTMELRRIVFARAKALVL